MGTERPSDGMPIGQLGHRPGLHVTVNLKDKMVGGVLHEAEEWVPGVVIGSGGDGTYATIQLDSPVGGERHGRFRRAPREQIIQIDDPRRVRETEIANLAAGAIPEEIIELARSGKKLEAIKRYRALNGATLDEARALIAKL